MTAKGLFDNAFEQKPAAFQADDRVGRFNQLCLLIACAAALVVGERIFLSIIFFSKTKRKSLNSRIFSLTLALRYDIIKASKGKEVTGMSRTQKRREERLAKLKFFSALIPLITALINLIIKLIEWLSD